MRINQSRNLRHETCALQVLHVQYTSNVRSCYLATSHVVRSISPRVAGRAERALWAAQRGNVGVFRSSRESFGKIKKANLTRGLPRAGSRRDGRSSRCSAAYTRCSSRVFVLPKVLEFRADNHNVSFGGVISPFRRRAFAADRAFNPKPYRGAPGRVTCAERDEYNTVITFI